MRGVKSPRSPIFSQEISLNATQAMGNVDGVGVFEGMSSPSLDLLSYTDSNLALAMHRVYRVNKV